MGGRTSGLQLRPAAALLDALEVGVLVLDGRNRPVALNRKAQDLLACHPDGSALPRPLLDLANEAWRCPRPCTRELALGGSVLRLHASRLEGNVLVQVHDVSLLRHLQQANRALIAAITDRLLERVEGPALLVEALASVDDPVLATQWLQRLRGDVAHLARLVGDAPDRPHDLASWSPTADDERAAEVSPTAKAGFDTDGPHPTLLLVEPVRVVADAMSVGLSNAGFDTVVAPDQQAALEVVKVARPDCVLMDIGQDRDIAAARRLREVNSVPMVLLTDRHVDPSLMEEVASDPATLVLRRPLRLRELVAKTRHVLAKAQADPLQGGAVGLLEAGEVMLDTSAQTVWVRGQRVAMSPKERQLLRALLLHPGRMLPYERLVELAWGDDGNGSRLGVYLRKLRRKVERDPSHPELIVTVRGIGVRFDAPHRG